MTIGWQGVPNLILCIKIEVAGILKHKRIDNIKRNFETEEQDAHQNLKSGFIMSAICNSKVVGVNPSCPVL
ncbi:unnamed protein product [Pieris brassicae]|uniref:Uncharacterized protein n=1 Tax=Pieris brassicae TaxID=7116 RepID=A0A9P0XD11_PIEBR|nr:unnamed protein product [Pieris brassicae]